MELNENAGFFCSLYTLNGPYWLNARIATIQINIKLNWMSDQLAVRLHGQTNVKLNLMDVRAQKYCRLTDKQAKSE